MKTPKASLSIPPVLWKQLRQAMLDARQDREETIGFLFCERTQPSKQQARYLPRAWVVPTADCYEYQTATGLVLEQDFHHYILNHFLADPNLHVVHIHTHSGAGLPDFSSIDDRAESEYAKFLSRYLKTRPQLISGVFDETIEQGQFRLWNRQGTGFQPIAHHHSWLESLPSPSAVLNPMFARQQIFGSACQQQLGQLKVALIGCGGIGAVMAETLGRLGVKNWILVDPDRLEMVNLNRMPGATPKMVDRCWPKVEYVKHLIKQIYPTGSTVVTIPTEISWSTPVVAAADLIIVATDNHASRQIAQEIAIKSMRPLVCLGTHIDITPDAQPRLYARVTIPPIGGHWCLMCGNIINLHRAALESSPLPIAAMAETRGYLENVPDPAVFWLNELCASTAVGAIHGIISGFLEADEGLDWIFDFSRGQWLKTDVESLVHPHCYFCGTS